MRFIKYFFIVQIMFLFFVSSLFSQGRLPNSISIFVDFDGKDLVDSSTHIVVGEVTKLEFLWVQLSGKNYFCKKVVIEPEIIIKGEIEDELVVYTPIQIVEAPDYELGERVVVFCYDRQEEGWFINTYGEFGKVTIKDGCVVNDGIIADAGTSLEEYIEKVQSLMLMNNNTMNTNEPKDIPATYNLLQNYPNPFNPTTTILYNVREDAFVKLAVYDMTGKVVKELVNEYKTAGIYSVEFNAGSYASGTYYCKLESGKDKAIVKMVLLK